MRRRSFLILALCATTAAAGPVAAAVRVVVPVSHATRLQIQGAAGSVIVGDPAVADAVAIDRHTIYVTGKAYGQTEIVVLDPDGRQIWAGDVAVISPDGGRVSVVRGPAGMVGNGPGGAPGILVNEYTCADVCTPAIPAPVKGK